MVICQELTIATDDVIALDSCAAGDPWWSGSTGGRRGLFPASYVRLLGVDVVGMVSAVPDYDLHMNTQEYIYI